MRLSLCCLIPANTVLPVIITACWWKKAFVLSLNSTITYQTRNANNTVSCVPVCFQLTYMTEQWLEAHASRLRWAGPTVKLEAWSKLKEIVCFMLENVLFFSISPAMPIAVFIVVNHWHLLNLGFTQENIDRYSGSAWHYWNKSINWHAQQQLGLFQRKYASCIENVVIFMVCLYMGYIGGHGRISQWTKCDVVLFSGWKR